MPYATEADLVDAAGGLRRLNELLDREPPEGEVDPRAYWLGRALAHGDSTINAYLPSRYATPLSAPSPYVVRLAAEEAVYWLASTAGVATEHEVTRAEERLEAYRDLRDGKIWPGDPPPEPTRGHRAVYVRSRLPLNGRSMKGWI